MSKLCSKIANFCPTQTGVTSKWGRILLGVYWLHQDLSTMYDVTGRCLMVLEVGLNVAFIQSA